MILTILLSLSLIFMCWCYWLQFGGYTARLIKKFPQAGICLPLFGHTYLFANKQDKLVYQFSNLMATFDETFALWLGIYPLLHVVTVEDAEIILSSSNKNFLDKGMIYMAFDQWLRKGLLVSSSTKWHQRRKMITPAFHYNILKVFADIFAEHCDNLIAILKKETTKSKTDIKPIIKKMTLATICETSMGIKLDDNREYLDLYQHALHKISEVLLQRILSPWLHSDLIYNMSSLGKKERALVEDLHKFSSDIIKEREETFRVEDITDLESIDKDSKKRLAMLDLLLFAKKHLGEIDDEGIREEVDTFVFTGHDTITAAVTFSLMTLANHKEIQDKIIFELNEIFGDSSRHATYDDLQNMKYLERCIKECLRLYPSVPFIARKLLEDVQLTTHVAPAGTDIVIHIFAIHHDAKYFPNPEKFDPDRFLPENIKGRHPYAFIPFSAGPRNCIGQRYAMLQMKSIISSILRNFTMDPITSPRNLTWFLDTVLNVKDPICVKFKSR